MGKEELGGRETGAVRFRFSGDEAAARTYIGFGRKLLGALKQYMFFNDIGYLYGDYTLPDKTHIRVMSNRIGLADQDEIWIAVTKGQKKKGGRDICLGFIARLKCEGHKSLVLSIKAPGDEAYYVTRASTKPETDSLGVDGLDLYTEEERADPGNEGVLFHSTGAGGWQMFDPPDDPTPDYGSTPGEVVPEYYGVKIIESYPAFEVSRQDEPGYAETFTEYFPGEYMLVATGTAAAHITKSTTATLSAHKYHSVDGYIGTVPLDEPSSWERLVDGVMTEVSIATITTEANTKASWNAYDDTTSWLMSPTTMYQGIVDPVVRYYCSDYQRVAGGRIEVLPITQNGDTHVMTAFCIPGNQEYIFDAGLASRSYSLTGSGTTSFVVASHENPPYHYDLKADFNYDSTADSTYELATSWTFNTKVKAGTYKISVIDAAHFPDGLTEDTDYEVDIQLIGSKTPEFKYKGVFKAGENNDDKMCIIAVGIELPDGEGENNPLVYMAKSDYLQVYWDGSEWIPY